jgi:lipopolysaccharide/colanic/teichoic acid biosynthesis glycosyltransferase
LQVHCGSAGEALNLEEGRDRLRRDLEQRPSRRERRPFGRRFLTAIDTSTKRGLDVVLAAMLLVLLALPIAVLALAIRLDSRGPSFYRCRRIGFRGREFRMLKFRKMHDDAAGPALTANGDARFTRIGRFLAETKLDELPQLWNVLKGEMSLVGPRPEDPGFVAEQAGAYQRILEVRPGITGLCQLAFAKESEILDPDDSLRHYLASILPQKVAMDVLYAERCSLLMDLRILGWTVAAVMLRRPVAVHRDSGRMNVRRRPVRELQPAAVREQS